MDICISEIFDQTAFSRDGPGGSRFLPFFNDSEPWAQFSLVTWQSVLVKCLYSYTTETYIIKSFSLKINLENIQTLLIALLLVIVCRLMAAMSSKSI